MSLNSTYNNIYLDLDNYQNWKFKSERKRVFKKMVTIKGEVIINHSLKDYFINEAYGIEIKIDLTRRSSPTFYEVEGKIPKEYHHYTDTNGLCLAAPYKISKIYNSNQSISNFIEILVIPYLFRFSCLKVYGEFPFGEYSHGIKGVLESYLELFEIENPNQVVEYLNLFFNEVPRYSTCPCKSGKTFNDCHLKDISKKLLGVSETILKVDLKRIKRYLKIKSKNKKVKINY